MGPGHAAPTVAPSGRITRLSHPQWERTVQDLFYLDEPTGLSDGLRPDARSGGDYRFDHHAESLTMDEGLWNAYLRAAADLADRVTARAEVLDRIGARADRATFLSRFAARAYRRPPSEEEMRELEAAYDRGPALHPELDGTAASVRHLLEAVLVSPLFLYRVERTVEADGGVVALDGWEIASRLSYALWNTMPDDELFAAAEDGSLSAEAGVAAQARRMLRDPRAAEVVERFHAQLLQWSELAGHIADFEGERAPVGAAAAARAEAGWFVREVVLARGGGLADLLTSPVARVDAWLADVYGVAPPADENETRELDPASRPGLLTRALFLVGFERGGQPDIIHRGLFVATRLLCQTVPPPPPDATAGLPPPEGDTNRERITNLTSAELCRGCHATVINPFGFVFEHYGADGRYRDEDDGFPIDASAVVQIDRQLTEVSGVGQLVDALIESREAHACYVRQWQEYLHGRELSEAEMPLVERFGEASRDEALSVEELLIALVTDRSFTARSDEELP